MIWRKIMNSFMLLSNYGSSSNPADAVAALFAGIMGIAGAGLFILIMAICTLVPLAISVFLIICNWKIFTKAGEEGWKAIIPFYNLYVFYTLATNKTTKNVCFFTIVGISAAGFLIGIIGMIPYLGWAIVGILSPVFGIANVVTTVFIAFLNFGIAKSFGMDTGLCVLSIFLPIVARPMIAFGKSEYTGDKLTIFGKPDEDIPTV